VLIDKNLSPEWVTILGAAGIRAFHWSTLGRPEAKDEEILTQARKESNIVLTQDLDFSQTLFQTAAHGPSVVILRIPDELDPRQHERVRQLLADHQEELTQGALMVIDANRARIRGLPIR